MEEQNLEELKAKVRRLPLSPGVYIMKDKTGHIIYIGKAKELKKRVGQYFLRFEILVGKVRKMVENVENFEYIITDSEFEALVLECSLIKQHKPKYNILLKDDKGYSYIRISLNELWPRISLERKKEEDGALFLGPYLSSFAVKEAIDEAVKAFMLPTCSRHFPVDIGRGRPCLNFFIHQCCAPCRGRMNTAEYREIIDNAATFLKGGYNLIIEQLSENMQALSQELNFEKAAIIRDRIAAIKKIRERQKVVASKVAEQDVIALVGDGCNTVFEIFIIRNGRLCDRDSYVFDYIEDEKAARAEFIRRYYSLAKGIPKQLTLDGETEDKLLLEQYLTGIAGRSVKITVPQKGEQAALAGMVCTNAKERLAQLSSRPEKGEKTLEDLKKLLGLEKTPQYIEAYDISHTAGSGMVAGMVVFEDGRPLKSAYKRFIIKTVEGQDDYASMREVVGRRLARLREATLKGETASFGFAKVPDLILLDGGRGHVSAVQPLLTEYGFEIPLYGMVKDDKHRTRAIAAGGEEIAINASRSVFTFISSIQEEVHRFSIAFHHEKRGKQTFSSRLTSASGIGESRSKALLKHFKTIQRMKDATVEELAAVSGMNLKVAEQLKSFLNNDLK
jgi:excinuclease ABC subunit C